MPSAVIRVVLLFEQLVSTKCLTFMARIMCRSIICVLVGQKKASVVSRWNSECRLHIAWQTLWDSKTDICLQLSHLYTVLFVFNITVCYLLKTFVHNTNTCILLGMFSLLNVSLQLVCVSYSMFVLCFE